MSVLDDIVAGVRIDLDRRRAVASEADEAPSGNYVVCGKHCESGDVLIERTELPEPARGDCLAVPATGAYTLAMSSNYNALERPRAIVVDDGAVSEFRSREPA